MLETPISSLSWSFECRFDRTPQQKKRWMHRSQVSAGGTVVGRGFSWPLWMVVPFIKSLCCQSLGQLVVATQTFFRNHPENWGRFLIWLIFFQMGWNHQPGGIGDSSYRQLKKESPILSMRKCRRCGNHVIRIVLMIFSSQIHLDHSRCIVMHISFVLPISVKLVFVPNVHPSLAVTWNNRSLAIQGEVIWSFSIVFFNAVVLWLKKL